MEKQENNYNFDKVFYDKTEKHIGTLGIGYLNKYLFSGQAEKAVLLLSNKRLYQKGTAYEKSSRGFTSLRTEKTVDVKDITGTTFQSVNPINLLSFGGFLGILSVYFFFMYRDSNDIAFFLLLISSIFIAFYFKSKRKYFIVEYAGGYIATDSSAYSENEITTFQQLVSNIKDSYERDKDSAPKNVNNNIDILNSDTMEAKINTLTDLLYKGLITQEEYNEMKRSVIMGN